jgi:colanic acid biosynthesis glycosyl transferase WcaI
MGKKQGLELLVEASRRLATRSEMQFVFCGEGTQRDQIAQMTSQANNVKFLPLQPADRLNDLLNLADIHLLPQRADAADLVMPSKLTGMLASGRPVVATAHRGTQLAEQLKGRGLIASPGDVNSFIAATNRLADDPDLRKRLGEEARKYAVRHLDRETILCRFEVCLYEARSQFVRPRKEKVSPSRPSKVRVT